ncbi:unnamed protein product [Owenia fusiformis]|uniref:Protein Wnt n=1 Tax=Owenia fusiformis TaxID=6347 RepID=A0A8J1Y5P9_OWEFU|nr:unnamed protein product [Owenia fusiformis]
MVLSREVLAWLVWGALLGVICLPLQSFGYFGLTARGPVLSLSLQIEENSTGDSVVGKHERNSRQTAAKICELLKLQKKQKRMCMRWLGTAETLVEAVRLSAIECHSQFSYERWNCTMGQFRMNLLKKGFKETSFLHGVTSAGLVHAFARACSRGRIDRCTCDESFNEKKNKETWRWGGCGDNIKFGQKFSRHFLKASKRSGQDLKAKVDRHNSNVGIRIVRDRMKTTCKCHGVSATCTVKTCWRQLAPFHEIGNVLKDKYENAYKVLSTLLLLSQPFNSQQGKKNRVRGIKWWSLGLTGLLPAKVHTNSVLNPSAPMYINPSLQPLTRKQRRLVTKNPGTILAVAKGAKVAIDECAYQFKNRRWNCPTDDKEDNVFGKILYDGCRETAFIYAITSAAISHTVAQSCSDGSVYTCSCDYTPQNTIGGQNWEWGGCSDNADFGYDFSQDFIDVVEKGRDLRCMMNLHNNEAGRTTVIQELRQECKCHGMSGSCTMKTCWKKLAPFRVVSHKLKDRFDGASRVFQGNSGSRRGSRSRSSRYNLVPVNMDHKVPGVVDLVYYEKSPTFCEADNYLNSRGTRGRECNATSIGVDGCDLMCCGRGHTSETYLVRERCNCTFHWCCTVNCDICTRSRIRNTCL